MVSPYAKQRLGVAESSPATGDDVIPIDGDGAAVHEVGILYPAPRERGIHGSSGASLPCRGARTIEPRQRG